MNQKHTQPAPTSRPRQSGFTLVELLVVISIIVVLAGLAVPATVGARNRADQVTGLNNVRGIKSALDLFASDFDGEYPNEATAREIAEIEADPQTQSSNALNGARLQSSTSLDLDTSAEKVATFADDYYQQLIGRGLDNEELFYMRSFKKSFTATKGNNDGKISSGENVWGYTKGLHNTSDSQLPIVFDTPSSLGEQPRFHKNTWDGKIMVARLDGSTRLVTIGGSDRKTGTVTARIDGGRVNIFSPRHLQEGELVPANVKLRNAQD